MNKTRRANIKQYFPTTDTQGAPSYLPGNSHADVSVNSLTQTTNQYMFYYYTVAGGTGKKSISTLLNVTIPTGYRSSLLLF